MSNFKTTCINCVISTTFVPLGVKLGVKRSKKTSRNSNFFGLDRCFSFRIEESSQMFKIQPKTTVFGRFFEVCSILAEKQQPKPKNSSSLKFFASFDTLLDPRGVKVKEISQFTYFVLKFDNSGALYNFFPFLQNKALGLLY